MPSYRPPIARIALLITVVLLGGAAAAVLLRPGSGVEEGREEATAAPPGARVDSRAEEALGAGETFASSTVMGVRFSEERLGPGLLARERLQTRPQELPWEGERDHNRFHFTRAIYSSGMGRGFWGRGSWSVDFPKADRQFLTVLRDVLPLLDASPRENPVRLDDPELRRFPFLYALEVGYMDLTQAEVEGLRNYLLAGGFLVVDDFWGSREWANFERQIRRVFPDRPIEEIEPGHPIFGVFYEVDDVVQVPNVGNARRGGPTHERDGYVPHVRGIHDDEGRLMVVINWNTDLGDAWEWSEQPYYPFEYSSYAYKMAANFIIYAMTH